MRKQPSKIYRIPDDVVQRLPVKRTHPDAKVPTRGTKGSGGLDLYSTEDVVIGSGDIVGIDTGVAFEIPDGYCGLLMTRSSMGRNGIRISAGANCIDADYRASLLVHLTNDGVYPWHVNKGDRIAQLVLVPVLMAEPFEVEELSQTQRGGGGFGSTGR